MNSSLLDNCTKDCASIHNNDLILNDEEDKSVQEIDPKDEDYRHNDTKVSKIVQSDNKVKKNMFKNLFGSTVSCNTYCVPLLVLVVIITVSILASLCTDIFKNKKVSIQILVACIINLVVVIAYYLLCQKCRNKNSMIQLIVSDVLPWLVYILIIGLVFLYILNKVVN